MLGRSALATAVAVATLAFHAPASSAQDSEIIRQIEVLARDNAPLYLSPITEGVSAALNRGTFYSAKPHGAFGFEIGLAAMGAFVPDFAETFVPVLPGEVTFDGQTFLNPYGTAAGATPTVAGDGDGVVIQPGPELTAAALAAGQDPAELALPFPQGLDIPVVPFAVIQAAIGLPGGTEVSVRGFPTIEVHDDVGEIRALGFSATHSISQYLPMTALSLAAHVAWQSADVGDYLDAEAFAYGLLASLDAGPVSIFGSGLREDPEVTLAYTVSNPTGNPALPRDGLRVAVAPDLDQTTRFTAGATLHLLAFKLSAAWTFGDYETLAVKALVAIR
ncbi:MAG: DUF6588 family protein [Gemmatimonadota bacterium]